MADRLSTVFGPEQEPWEQGVYVTHVPRPHRFALWTGEHWCAQRRNKTDAALAVGRPAAFQSKRWQGLAEKPQ